MIRRILWRVVIGIFILLLLLWLISGGFSAVGKTARTLVNPVSFIVNGSTSGSAIRLPWQIDAPLGADLSGSTSASSNEGQTPEEYAQAYRDLSKRAVEAQTFGDPSSYAGKVSLRGGETSERDPSREYIEIEVSGSSPVNITSWSLQSAVSGERLFIPPVANPFILGSVNTLEPAYLAPGDTAIVVSGPSPVGVSFHENMCTGYLNELQQYVPPLSNDCPRASDALSETPDTLRIYGASCFDYVASIPQCHFPGVLLPSSLSAPCRSYLVNTYSYNGCVQANRYDPSFPSSAWRIYLNSRVELWDNAHDIIRLLDSQGRTVDTLTY